MENKASSARTSVIYAQTIFASSSLEIQFEKIKNRALKHLWAETEKAYKASRPFEQYAPSVPTAYLQSKDHASYSPWMNEVHSEGKATGAVDFMKSPAGQKLATEFKEAKSILVSSGIQVVDDQGEPFFHCIINNPPRTPKTFKSYISLDAKTFSGKALASAILSLQKSGFSGKLKFPQPHNAYWLMNRRDNICVYAGELQAAETGAKTILNSLQTSSMQPHENKHEYEVGLDYKRGNDKTSFNDVAAKVATSLATTLKQHTKSYKEFLEKLVPYFNRDFVSLCKKHLEA